jgi:segregation and condensation protein B
VKILGRKDEPGRPLVYGTTPGFLEFFGLSGLKDLPTLQEFSDLTDEHKALFEQKTGEAIDVAAAELAATEALEQAEEELLAEEEAAIAAAEALAAADDEQDDDLEDDDVDEDDEDDEEDEP